MSDLAGGGGDRGPTKSVVSRDSDGGLPTKVIVVAGRRYTVRSNASDALLADLISEVEERAVALSGGGCVTLDSIMLVAIALAAEAREEAHRADRIAKFAHSSLVDLLARVDAALGPDRCVVSGDLRP